MKISKWIFEYSLKENIVKDTIAGITVGIVQIAPSISFFFKFIIQEKIIIIIIFIIHIVKKN